MNKRKKRKIIKISTTIISSIMAGMVLGYAWARKEYVRLLKGSSENGIKLNEFYQVFVRWLTIKNKGISIASWLKKKGIATVAIYGMKELGELLYDELKNSDIDVKYCIDRNAENIIAESVVLKPTDVMEQVDAVIVTAIHYYDEIEEELKDRKVGRVLSLEDVLYEMESFE